MYMDTRNGNRVGVCLESHHVIIHNFVGYRYTYIMQE